MSNIKIQPAKALDFIAIAALDRIAWKEGIDSEFIPDGEHAWRVWTEHALTFIARDTNADIIGVVLAFPTIGQGYCLHKIMVVKKHRGQGIGAKLLTALLATIDSENASCFLTVSPANRDALKLYRQRGFTQEKFYIGYYRATEDRFLLTRPRNERNSR
jgi:ribosomal-protein-alanine N-acetyltransferase